MAMRHASILFLSILAVHGGDLWSAVGGLRRAAPAPASVQAGGHVILVVADGLRWQEVFRGADAAILASDASLGADGSPTRVKYWRPTVEERRAALMPFLWSTIAREGTLMGNRDAGGRVDVTNPMKFSYPGYNELLVGWPDARIDRNDFGPNPNVTVFEWLNRRAEVKGSVAAFGMWDTFRDIFNVERSHLPVADFSTDSETNHAALRYLEEHAPRALFVGFGATDDFGHKGRYDMVLDAAHAIDGYLSMLWAEAQSSPASRGRTTLIVVADHGRGRTPKDWKDHNHEIPGSEETWIAVIGPGIPGRGHVRDRATLSQTAATVAASLGLDYAGQVRRAAPSIFSITTKQQPLIRMTPD